MVIRTSAAFNPKRQGPNPKRGSEYHPKSPHSEGIKLKLIHTRKQFTHTPSLSNKSISAPSSDGIINGRSDSTLPFLQIKFTSRTWCDLCQLADNL